MKMTIVLKTDPTIGVELPRAELDELEVTIATLAEQWGLFDPEFTYEADDVEG